MSGLTDLREEIDLVDEELVDLLQKRFKLTEQVGIYKLRSKDTILQSGRWEEVLAKLRAQAELKGLSPVMLENIWNEIHSESRAQQLKVQKNANK